MNERKLILHWDAGVGTVNSTNKEHYHFMVDKNAIIHSGNHTIADNENCKDGDYCQHTAGMNTNNIGFSFLGMADYNPSITGKIKTSYPINKKQLEAGLKYCAMLCKKYNITIDDEHVMTHYEVSEKVKNNIIHKNNLIDDNIGKIDFYYLPCYPKLKPNEIGDFLKDKIKWYMDKI